MTAHPATRIEPTGTESTTATRTRVLVMAYDRIGERMAGPGVRSWEIAKSLARVADVTIASSTPVGRTADGVTSVLIEGERQLGALAQASDVIIVQGLTLRRHPSIARSKAVLVVDLYDPWVMENLELHASLSDRRCAELLLADADAQNELVDAADFFICASERQRDYWLGMLTSRGRIDRSAWLADAELRDLIDVVAYGCPEAPPEPRPVLRGVHPDIKASDSVFLWSGGVWEWFDPILAVDAFADAARQEPDMVLFFMGLGLPGSTPDMPVARLLHQRAAELREQGIRIAFGDWVPYDERGAYLDEAAAALIATRPSVESRLSFRSRMLDHFWAGLPTITTPGDVLADLVDSSGAGVVYPHGDRAALTEALLRIHRDQAAHAGMSARARDLAERFRWSETTAPLRRVTANPSHWIEQRDRRLAHLAKCGIKPDWREGAYMLPSMRHGGFHSRGPIMDALKRSGLYPFMRWVRRTALGRRLWGPVPE